MAERQHGVVARAQLLDIGHGRRRVEHRIATGWLHPLHRGVHAVGHARLSHDGWLMAAVLAAGRNAALSHRSAGASWDIVRHQGRIEVTTPGERRRPGMRIFVAWPARRVGVELDSRAHHADLRAFERDRAKDRAPAVAGWRASA